MMIFSGNATPKLAQEIADYLEAPLGRAVVGTFSDGETMVEILENVRGQDIFVVQSTCAPSNNNLMELLAMADALRRASANRITAVVPYFGYARQDRRVRSARVPISAKIVADMMHSVGFSRLITVDLHADQIQGFFYMPVDNVYSTTCVLEDIRQQNFSNPLIVSPDVGGVVRARAVAKRLNDTDLAIIDKRRPSPNESMVMNIIGDVRGRDCILIDDIIDTGGTLCSAAEALKNSGATTVTAYCTHPVLSGKAIEKINRSVIDQVVVSDTIPLSNAAQKCQRIRVIGLGNIIAETIYRICGDESVSEMFA